MMRLPQTHRELWKLSVPMMLSGLSVPMISLTDTAVLGYLPEHKFLAAMAVGVAALHFLFWAFGFLRMATTGLCAQRAGAGDEAGLLRVFHQSLLLAVVIAVLLVALQAPLLRSVELLFAPAPELRAPLETYFRISLLSAPALFAFYVLWGFFLGLGHAAPVLISVFFVNFLNAVLDVFFVIGLGMDVDGVAWASVCAEYAGFALALFLFARILRKRGIVWQPRGLLPDPAMLKGLLVINHRLFTRTLLLLFTYAFFSAQASRLGAGPVAGNVVLLNLFFVFTFACDGIIYAVESLSGRALGRRDLPLFNEYVRAGMLWSWGLAFGLAAAYAVAGGWMIDLLTTLETVREVAKAHVLWIALLTLVGVACFVYDGVFIGALGFREMRDAMLVAVALVYLPVWALARPLGNDGLWLALAACLLARSLLMHFYYHRRVLPRLRAEQAAPAPAT